MGRSNGGGGDSRVMMIIATALNDLTEFNAAILEYFAN